MAIIAKNARRAAIFGCSAGVIGALTASFARGQTNLLPDPSFEAGIDGAPDATAGDVPMVVGGPWSGWNNWVGPYSGYYENTASNGQPAHTGTQFAKTFSAPNAGIYQFIPANAGDTYTASAWFVNSTMGNGGIDALSGAETDDVRMIFFAVPNPTPTTVALATDVTPVPVSDLTPANIWTQLTVTAVAPPGTESVQWMAFFNDPGGAGGALYVDDGSLVDDTVVTTPNLSWNNTGGTGNGATWDTTQQNWNNGTGPATYSDGANVTFNDSNVGHYAVTLNSTVTPNSVTVNNSAGNYVISGTGSIAGASTTLSKSGSDALTLENTGVNTYGGGTTVSAGTLLIGAAGALPANSSVSVTGGTLELGASTGGETLSSLSISGGGTLDVNNNHIIIAYTGPQAAADALIRGYLVSGYAGGAWTGAGIDSSAVAGSTHYGLGYADGADLNGASPLVAGLGAGNIEVKYTLYGDANLDGVVNGTDFGILAAHFGDQETAWDAGDFNYDGVVNGSDFGALAANFGQQANGTAVQLPASDYAALDAFAAANGLLADVPEPASAGLLFIAGMGILGRRKRRVQQGL
jgi:autotransporter-associated beta strand protein